MRYQLILQWPVSGIDEYDNMISVEDALIDALGDLALVDGHDAGSGEVNIFILTDNPKLAFQMAAKVLGSKGILNDAKAAFRECNGSTYEILWPLDANSFSLA